VEWRLGRRPGLDGIRGLAIALVLATHTWYLWPSGWFNGGSEGVDVFFVLSGFLITSLLLEEYADSLDLSLGAFYKRRALRLFPALYLMLTVAFVASRLIHSVAVGYPLGGELGGIGETVGYIYNWRFLFTPTLGAWGIAQVWSLGVEEQFYVFWPLLLLLLLRRRPSCLGAVALGVGLISYLVGVVVWTATHNRNYVYYPTTAGLVGLMVGAFLAWAVHRGVRFGSWTTPAGFAALAFLGWMLRYASVTDGWFYLWAKPVLALAAGVLILACLEPGRALTRVFSVAPIRYLGRISYSLYLWHYLVISGVLALGPRWSPGARIAFAYAIAVALAAASYHVVERPFLRLAHRRRAGTFPVASARAG